MSGLFETYGIDATEIPESTGGIPAGTYEATVLKAEVLVGTKKDPEAINFIIYYRINGTEMDVREYFSLPRRPAPWDDTTVIRTDNFGKKVTEKSHNEWIMGNLRDRLVAIGVPPEKVNTVKPEDLQGIPVVLTLVEKDGYTNVKRGKTGARAPKAEMGALPGAPETPASSPTTSAGFTPNWG